MPILILLGIGAFYLVVSLYNTCTTNTKPYSNDELDSMLSQMVGKSKKECRKILKQHRK